MPKINHRAKLAELRALRQSGKKAFENYRVDDASDLYDEVDEDGYKKIVRSRLNEDDFVVDDNGEGYADDGREDWDRVRHYDSDSDLEDQPVAKTKADDDFLADLLGEVDNNIPAPVPRPSKVERSGDRRKSRALSPAAESIQKRQKRIDTRLPSPPAGHFASDDGFIPPADDDLQGTPEVPMSDPPPSSPAARKAERKAQIKQDPEDDEDSDMMEVAHTGAVNSPSVNMAGSRPVKKLLKQDPYPSPASSSPLKQVAQNSVDSASWSNVTEKLNVVNQPTETRGIGKIDHNDAIEADGSLHFFWTDYTEINGSLCLFGKVLNKKTNVYVSCFIKVDNILRKLFFLPRPQRVRDGESTDETVEMMDVYEEVDEMMTKMKVDMHKIKACSRKYAFELSDVPKEAQYMKLLYPYTKPQIDVSTTGETFAHVFGANTALFEQFVLWKNIMGPCWLKIQDADFGAIKNASHCKLEVLAEHPNMVSTIKEADNLDAPPLTLMSVSLRTAFNAKENKQEILAISARIYDKVLLSDTTPAEKLPCRTFTVIRPHGQGFPMGFDQLAKKRNRGVIVLKKAEADILTFFLAQVDVADPDVILGHQLEGVDYSVLLSRLHEKKIHQWSRLGRLRRTQWPASMGKAGGNVFAERQVIAGRLLCDLANDAGKSAMYKCQTWSLTEMCSLYLSGDNRRRDVDNEVALNSWAKEKQGLMDYITHMEADTHFIAALALIVQLLPLTKVLTNLAGNSWARTLTGTRAERNEYILLHEFHRNKYICPDKRTFRGRQKMEEENQEEGSGEGKKKDKYKGGLVFEPDKGLYDKFVLVMDFNSLYPSIIQEFNICFTTVDRTASTEDEDDVPEVPTDQELGVLPRLIATLVGRRRQVKALMKDKSATSEQLATWDIKQLALKLTANSMYGCLGYTKSRFYARPLAVLTTFKGREILRSTKELAESKSLQVIYGDTDSVMINANVDSVADAFRVGNEFKKAVNDQYRLLEIDIDNVFRRILLQAKKKYAAINLIEKDGKFVEQMEVKGLDMRRREYCALSKEISKHLLDEILSGDEAEVAIARIHEYLRDIASKMREQSIPVTKYIIYTQLGKGPKEYPNADSMPQVQVALRDIARGRTVRKGDVISYIITGDGKSSEPAPKRAYAPADLKTDNSLVPDVEWYLGKQIFPPVERLCANIIGTSTSQLAEQLGLDIRHYSSHQTQQNNSSDDIEIHPLESQIPDEVRFGDCARLLIRCRKCKFASAFEGLATAPERVSAAGLLCGGCGAIIPTLCIVAQVEHAVRQQTSKYYEGWLICDDSQCGNKTRQMSVYGTRCLGPKGLAHDCLGRMRYEYTEKAIYNQLVYFASLWDVERARAKASDANNSTLSRQDRDTILALAEHNRVRFGTVKGVVDRYLEKCGRQWVAMDTLFAKLGFNKLFVAA
ncbi:DNA-directed DNA polymerase alpha catalytic subunit pol1 [Conoideocrella luteorostrata]|uniref:DNA polymerase n=1 Tax=Conoideocrella luteorostrata TaxID=1105319 RepID=A0AAJ0CJP4_9HYPO|nr:DNA-directed DNA polymerase alpha catalytic subunit pol1 [Conoideocrella luteorostrata]